MPLVHYNHYNEADFNDKSSSLIPVGKHRVRIEKAEQGYSHKTKSLMIILSLAVSGYSSTLRGYIVLDDSSQDAIKKTNRYLGSVFDGFKIPHGDLELEHWIGHIGGVKVNHREGNDGNIYPNVQYFLYRDEVDKLPAWGTPNNKSNNPREALTTNTEQTKPEATEIPF